MSETHPTPSVKLAVADDGSLLAQTSTGATTRNKLEIAAALQMQDAGYEVIRNGWPDFLAVRGDEIVFVEVKHENDAKHFSPAQKKVLSVLRSLGLTVKVMAPTAIPPNPPCNDDIAEAVDVLRDAHSVGITMERSPNSDDWLPKLIASLPTDTVLVVPDSRAWNSCKAAQSMAIKRRLRVDHVKPHGKITNLREYEMALASEIVNKAQAVVVVTDGGHEPSMWAISVASARLKPTVVLDTSGRIVRLRKDGA